MDAREIVEDDGLDIACGMVETLVVGRSRGNLCSLEGLSGE